MIKKFIPQYQPVVKLKYIFSVVKQMLSGWVGAGETVINFENKLAEITTNKHVISTTSGTMALYLALSSLEIPKNKKIIFPSYTFLAGANVIQHLGYDIEFLDVNMSTLCLDPHDLENKLFCDSDKIGAVIYVNHNGNSTHAKQIKEICQKYNVKMIEDSAQALGMFPAGTYGDISILSFSVPKLVTTGQGGAVMTNDDFLATKMKRLRDHGDNWRQSKIHNFIGLNLKFNDISAAYGLSQLNSLKNLLSIRKNIFDQYRKYIELFDSGLDSTWMVIYKTNKANLIIDELKKENIQSVKYYKSIPSNPSFKIKKKYPNAEYIYDNYIYLPSSLNLSKRDINRICKIINRIENEK